jgi:hypothetical protein
MATMLLDGTRTCARENQRSGDSKDREPNGGVNMRVNGDVSKTSAESVSRKPSVRTIELSRPATQGNGHDSWRSRVWGQKGARERLSVVFKFATASVEYHR